MFAIGRGFVPSRWLMLLHWTFPVHQMSSFNRSNACVICLYLFIYSGEDTSFSGKNLHLPIFPCPISPSLLSRLCRSRSQGLLCPWLPNSRCWPLRRVTDRVRRGLSWEPSVTASWWQMTGREICRAAERLSNKTAMTLIKIQLRKTIKKAIWPRSGFIFMSVRRG